MSNLPTINLQPCIRAIQVLVPVVQQVSTAIRHVANNLRFFMFNGEHAVCSYDLARPKCSNIRRLSFPHSNKKCRRLAKHFYVRINSDTMIARCDYHRNDYTDPDLYQRITLDELMVLQVTNE